MARRLVVCCDGTWNKPRTNTNVYRTYAHLRASIGSPDEDEGRIPGSLCCSGHAADGAEVLLYYDKGVGTEPWDWLTGGALGSGLSDNVRGAYRFLSQSYRPGDSIYVFGFSRGAYTARSLCGFIAATKGLLVDASREQVLLAYMRYYATRSRLVAPGDKWSVDAALGWFKGQIGGVIGRELDDAPRHAGARVRFCGVYDTVGALGIPLPRAEKLNQPVVGFHDTSLGSLVEHAVHALAVDERRGPYEPTLWRLPTGVDALPAGQTCLQVWFPGVHSDIGGGYADKGIGNVALDFMLRRAAERGLFGDDPRGLPTLRLETLPAQHDSMDSAWNRVGQMFANLVYLRPLGPSARRDLGMHPSTAAGREMLHPALVARLGRQVRFIKERPRGGDEIVEGPYAPPNVPRAEIEADRFELPVFRERRELRLPFDGPSDLDGAPCTIADRSEGGARVVSDAAPAAGAVVRLGGRPGRVAWSSGREAGIEFRAGAAALAA